MWRLADKYMLTLLVVPARQATSVLAESIPGLLKLLQIRALRLDFLNNLWGLGTE
jgi:hypothetical protein